ncbi:glyoxylase I family protein [Klenkia soli]|uniref:Glyoxylase I family protein n=1 Tax=Klenkia soli TaxID=1052260 RepID=A0A1H0KA34_9ACTN|nr:VOC family protein [Klenkia soli]SDO52838.1 glyoxylase I family protein [Klenkia soli]
MPITPTGFAHVRLTVTDIARSKQFYDSVFGLPVAVDGREGDPEWAFGGVIYQIDEKTLWGLRPVGDDSFDEDRTGLDHLSVWVESKEAIDAAAAHLDSLGIAHEEVKDIGIMYILEFRDPDGVALELSAPK